MTGAWERLAGTESMKQQSCFAASSATTLAHSFCML